jgi:hypothetical protein
MAKHHLIFKKFTLPREGKAHCLSFSKTIVCLSAVFKEKINSILSPLSTSQSTARPILRMQKLLL